MEAETADEFLPENREKVRCAVRCRELARRIINGDEEAAEEAKRLLKGGGG